MAELQKKNRQFRIWLNYHSPSLSQSHTALSIYAHGRNFSSALIIPSFCLPKTWKTTTPIFFTSSV